MNAWVRLRDCTDPECGHYRIAGRCRIEACPGCGREFHVLGASDYDGPCSRCVFPEPS